MSSSDSTLTLHPLADDPTGALPRYAAIRSSLLTAIRQDAQAVGKSLPIERDIAAYYEVSRLTARQAIDLLEREGYVRKRRGKPTEVIRQSPRAANERPLQRLSDILGSSARRQSRVLSFKRLRSAPAAQLLQLAETEWLYCLRLEQFGEQGKLGFTEVYFPEAVGRKLSRRQFEQAAQEGTLFVFPLVERETGYRAKRARVTIGAADLLQIGDHEITQHMSNRPLVRLQFVFLSQDGVPFQATINWFDSRFYNVTYELGD